MNDDENITRPASGLLNASLLKIVDCVRFSLILSIKTDKTKSIIQPRPYYLQYAILVKLTSKLYLNTDMDY